MPHPYWHHYKAAISNRMNPQEPQTLEELIEHHIDLFQTQSGISFFSDEASLLKVMARSIAQATVAKVRPKTQADIRYPGDEGERWNDALAELDRKAAEWLGSK